MATLIRNRQITADSWRLLDDAAPWVAVGEDGLVPDFPADVGLIVDVIPHINTEGLVIMDVAPEIDSQVQGGSVKITSGVTAPIFDTRRAQSHVAIKDGQIAERGTHDQLLAARGYYYDLYMSQFRRDLEFTEAIPAPA